MPDRVAPPRDAPEHLHGLPIPPAPWHSVPEHCRFSGREHDKHIYSDGSWRCRACGIIGQGPRPVHKEESGPHETP